MLGGSFGSKKGSNLHPSIIGLCFARRTPESSSSHLDQMQHELAPPPASMLLALAEPRRPWAELATSKLAEALFFPNSGGIRGEGGQVGAGASLSELCVVVAGAGDRRRRMSRETEEKREVRREEEEQ